MYSACSTYAPSKQELERRQKEKEASFLWIHGLKEVEERKKKKSFLKDNEPKSFLGKEW